MNIHAHADASLKGCGYDFSQHIPKYSGTQAALSSVCAGQRVYDMSSSLLNGSHTRLSIHKTKQGLFEFSIGLLNGFAAKREQGRKLSVADKQLEREAWVMSRERVDI